MALARTGLLEGYKAAVLWEVLPSAREEFANLDLTEDLFSIDRNRMTAGGVLATLDMMMVYIHAHHGRELTVAIANELTMTQVRSGNEPQTMRRYTEPWAAHAKLAKAIEEMKVNLEAPLSIDTIASLSGISCTQLRRLSEKYLETTPSRFYLTLRLRKSRELVLYSKMQMTEIALACGFSSSSTFARAFQAHFHISASEYRRRHQSNLSRPYIDPPEQNIVRDGLFPFNDEDAPI
jgi:transcriptional regulator GlxA family with amidase domain